MVKGLGKEEAPDAGGGEHRLHPGLEFDVAVVKLLRNGPVKLVLIL